MTFGVGDFFRLARGASGATLACDGRSVNPKWYEPVEDQPFAVIRTASGDELAIPVSMNLPSAAQGLLLARTASGQHIAVGHHSACLAPARRSGPYCEPGIVNVSVTFDGIADCGCVGSTSGPLPPMSTLAPATVANGTHPLRASPYGYWYRTYPPAVTVSLFDGLGCAVPSGDPFSMSLGIAVWLFCNDESEIRVSRILATLGSAPEFGWTLFDAQSAEGFKIGDDIPNAIGCSGSSSSLWGYEFWIGLGGMAVVQASGG